MTTRDYHPSRWVFIFCMKQRGVTLVRNGNHMFFFSMCNTQEKEKQHVHGSFDSFDLYRICVGFGCYGKPYVLNPTGSLRPGHIYIYRGQERPARDRLRLSQVHHHVYSQYTPCLTDLYLWVHPTPYSPDPRSFILDICRVNPRQQEISSLVYMIGLWPSCLAKDAPQRIPDGSRASAGTTVRPNHATPQPLGIAMRFPFWF
jgi:hypothetical protein